MKNNESVAWSIRENEVTVEAHKDSYILACWHKVVSRGSEYLQIQEIPFKAQSIKKRDLKEPMEIKGGFAYYPEGLFCLYKNMDDELVLSWNDRKLSVKTISTVQWSHGPTGRRFTAFGAGGEVLLDFKYHTLLIQVIRHPLATLFELFFPDDDWGLVADMPSWVDSGFSADDLDDSFRKILKDYNKG